MSRKAIIFARVSTARQEKEGLSLKEVQLPRMREYAQKHELEVVQEFVIQETADSKMRAKFHEMVEFVKARQDIEVLLAFRVNRITRNFRDAVTIDELRNDFGKEIHFVESSLIISKHSRSSDVTRWDTDVFVAKQMINQAKEDAHNTKYNKLEAGELPWTAPYGYTNVHLGRRLSDVVPDQFESGIVKQAMALHATGTYSLDLLRTKLRDDHGAKLSKSNLQKILSDKFYIGLIWDKETGQYYPHRYQQFITSDLFEAVQAVVQGRSWKKSKQQGKLPFAYRGLLTCATCGCAITPEHKRNKKVGGQVNEYDYYHCTERHGKHGAAWVTDQDLTEQFQALFRSIKVPQEEVERIQQALTESHDGKKAFMDAEWKKCQTDYDRLQKRIERSYDLLGDQSITLDEHNQNVARWRKEQDALLARQKRLKHVDEKYYVTVSYLLELASRADELFAAATMEEKRQLIGLVCQNRLLNEKTLDVTLVAPFDAFSRAGLRSGWRARPDSNR